MKNKYAQTKEQLLLSLINRQTPQAKINGRCTYNQDYNGGCAIGCQVTPKKAANLINWSIDEDEENNKANDNVFSSLPKRLQKMGSEFLSRVQDIHDSEVFWNDAETGDKINGLVWNEEGKSVINKLIGDFALNIPKLK